MPRDIGTPARYAPQRVEIVVHPDGLFYVYIRAKSGATIMRDDTGEVYFRSVRKRAIHLANALGVTALFNEYDSANFFELGFIDEAVLPYYTSQAVKREQAKWPRKERTKKR